MKILLIDVYSSFLDLAWRAQMAGHEVRWFQSKTREGLASTVGKGMVLKVPDWESSMRWADLILLADNVRYLPAIEKFRRMGFPIVGPNMECARWELDRACGQGIMARAGIKIMESTSFSSLQKAQEHLLANPKRYVSKPNADDNKALSYVSKSARDMMFMLEYWKKNSSVKTEFIFQEFTPGIEVAVGGWFGPHGFNGHWLENFEHKKLMNGEISVNCYSADTEVLTSAGWKFWPDVVDTDEICTLRDGRIEFEKPSRLTVAEVEEDLVGWKATNIDILVTAGHNMYVQDCYGTHPFGFESADVTAQYKRQIRKGGGGTWHGEDANLPTCARSGHMEFAALVGAYIADGSLKKRSVVFGNCPEHKQAAFIEIAQAAGFAAQMYGPDLYINAIELVQYLEQFGTAVSKRCPQFIKNGTVETIEAFLYGYGTGDGSNRPGNVCYSTVSKLLADDLQELLLKVGKYGSISVRDRRGESHLINGYECVNRHVGYDIGVSEKRLKSMLLPEDSYRLPYKGKVYCCTVTSHIIYVRRNGKACWLGQTGEMGTVLKYVKKSLLAEKLLEPIAPELYRQGYTGYIDVSVMVAKNGDPLPLEFTCRPGWPLQQILQCLHKGDPVMWLYDLVHGKDTMDVKDEIATGVVMAIPDYPYSQKTKKEVSGYPVYGWEKIPHEHFHACELQYGQVWEQFGDKLGQDHGLVTAGDYVCVITGSADTGKESHENAYKNLKKIEIPNSPMYRTDIGHRIEKQLPLLQEHGYCEEWSYE